MNTYPVYSTYAYLLFIANDNQIANQVLTNISWKSSDMISIWVAYCFALRGQFPRKRGTYSSQVKVNVGGEKIDSVQVMWLGLSILGVIFNSNNSSDMGPFSIPIALGICDIFHSNRVADYQRLTVVRFPNSSVKGHYIFTKGHCKTGNNTKELPTLKAIRISYQQGKRPSTLGILCCRISDSWGQL